MRIGERILRLVKNRKILETSYIQLTMIVIHIIRNVANLHLFYFN